MYWGGRLTLDFNPFFKERADGVSSEWKCGGGGNYHPFAQEGGGRLNLNGGRAYCLKRGGMYWGGRFISQGGGGVASWCLKRGQVHWRGTFNREKGDLHVFWKQSLTPKKNVQYFIKNNCFSYMYKSLSKRSTCYQKMHKFGKCKKGLFWSQQV